MPMSLAEIALGASHALHPARITSVGGPRAFRRRLLEMGLVPGVEVRVVAVAPFGDPLRIEVRGGQWSIRRDEAAQIEVEQSSQPQAVRASQAAKLEVAPAAPSAP